MVDLLVQIKSALAPRYEVEREIGSGGMATVYRARDSRHERQVAVKVLRSELAAALGSERFLREIRITARLNHPHILPLLDSGEAAGFLYYVMPYVAGGSLRRRLSDPRPLPLDEALRIARQVATALDYAHGHHVIHRDVKPENILFSEGLPVVADFGIARAVTAAGPERLTRSGMPVGTPGYMSPEQAMGTRELDERTDVYSLGCVTYEMLVGATPAAWPSGQDVRLGRMSDAPPDHRARLDALPGRIEQALTRALALRPADRFATPGEFAAALAGATSTPIKLSDGEVRAVVRRAAQLQVEHPTENGALTIGAVEQIAAEVGIPPEHVREAVRELGLRTPAPAPAVRAGTPAVFDSKRSRLLVDREVEGEVADATYELLVEEIQSTLGTAGHVSTLGKTLTWSPATPGSEGRRVVVTITRAEGRTLIHIEERLELTSWRMWVPAWGAGAGTVIGLLMMTALGEQAPGALIPILLFAVGGGYLSVNGLILAMANHRRPQLQELADRLASIAEGAAHAALPPGASGGTAP